ncbi:reverse transcriptase domain-containing protein [Tanacetum coccineum]
MANVTSLLTNLCNNFKDSASTLNSGTLPSQTVTNPRQQINTITTRSGKTLEGPSTPLVLTPVVSNPQKEPEQNPETSTEKVQNPNLENTVQVPPSEEEESIFMEIPKPKAKKTVNVEIQDLNSPRPNSYQSKLPYPERMKVRENDKPSAQHSMFLKMFKQLRLEIGLKDALVEMPKFNKCSPSNLEDPAIINLIPQSTTKLLGLGALTPTRMTLELANHSITHPMGIAEDVVVRVDGFTFLADFVVVNFVPDPRVPIILGRPFLPTAKALIDLYEETLTLRSIKTELCIPTIPSDALFPSSSPMKTSDSTFEEFIDEFTLPNSLPPGDDDSIHKKDIHKETFQMYSNPLFEFDDNFKSSNVNPLFEKNDKDVKIKSSPSFTLTSPEESELIWEEFEAYLEGDLIPPGIDLNLPPTLEVSSSNPTSLTLTGEKLSASITLNSLGNEDKVFKPSILVYHTIHDKNLVTLEKNLRENISSGTLLFLKESSSPRPPPEPPDVCMRFQPILAMKNDFVKPNGDSYLSKTVLSLHVKDVDSFTFIIWTFLPYFTYPKDSPLIFSFRSENFVFDPGIVTFLISYLKPVAFSMEVSCSKCCSP